jgi:hypothetical protein
VLLKPVSETQRLEVVRREDMVHLEKLAHVIVRGLAVDATAKMHAGYGFRVFGCSDVVLEDCAATRCGKHHFGIINSTAVELRRCHASLVMPGQGVGGASAFVSYSDKSRKGDTSRYEGCIVENYADTGKGQYPAFVTHGEGIGSIVISGLKSRGAGLTFNNRESGAALSLVDSTIEDAGIGLFGKGSVLEDVTLTRGVLTLDGSANQVRRCRLLGLNPGFQGYQAAVVNTGTDNVMEDTEISLDPVAKPFNAAIALVNPQSRLTWTGCRITTPACVVRTQFLDVKAAASTAKGNTYPANATFILKGRDKPLMLSEWQAFGLDDL